MHIYIYMFICLFLYGFKNVFQQKLGIPGYSRNITAFGCTADLGDLDSQGPLPPWRGQTPLAEERRSQRRPTSGHLGFEDECFLMFFVWVCLLELVGFRGFVNIF